MRTILKKAGALLLALVMTLGLTVTAFADGEPTTASLSVNADKIKAGNAYTAYQVMTATIVGTDSSGDPVYEYTVNDAFKGFFGDDKTYKLNSDNEIVRVSDNTVIATDGFVNTNVTAAAALASSLAEYAAATGFTGTGISLPTTEKIAIGYYVVAETTSVTPVASKPILVDLREDTVVDPKDSDVELEKKIVEGTGENRKLVDENNVSIGDTINYQVESNIPEYKANVDKTKLSYVFTDTFTHITFNNDMVVKVDNSTLTNTATETMYTLSVGTDNKSFTLSLSQDVILANQGKNVVLTYSGTLQDTAVVDDTAGNPNKITLNYTNNPDIDNSEGELEDEVKTYTYGFKLHKVDKNDESKDMAGAAFAIKDSNNNVIGRFVYGTNGVIEVLPLVEGGTDTGKLVIGKVGDSGVKNYAEIKGVDAGDYYIQETSAPSGYSLLGSDVKVTIEDVGGATPNGSAKITIGTTNATLEETTVGSETITNIENNNGTIDLVVKIVNTKGISLPETGERTMMYCLLGGAIMIIFGGLYFGITKKVRK